MSCHFKRFIRTNTTLPDDFINLLIFPKQLAHLSWKTYILSDLVYFLLTQKKFNLYRTWNKQVC